MNRKPPVYASLSRILIILMTVCAPLMAWATTTATPTFSLTAGTYTGAQTVTILDSTSGSTIYYTTNGATPTTSSSKYTGSITVSATESLKAIATTTGDTNSAVVTAAYTIVTPTPTFSPVAGSYGGAQTVTISDSNSAATIYYTKNGTTPTTSSTKYTGAFTVSSTETLEALATATGNTNSAVATAPYTLVTPTPTFSLAGGSYFGTQTVTISDSNSAATLYYTTNGTTPTTSSTKYAGTITVSSTESMEALAVITGYTNSAVATVTYTITTTPGTLSVYLSQPGAQSTTVSGAATETFDALATGIHTTAYVSSAGIGTFTGSSTQPFAVVAPNEFGGATDSTSSTPTNYFAVGTESGSTSPVYLALAQPVSYFGFWWSAGDEYNRVALYSGSALYGTFSTADLLSFLNNGAGTIDAINGTAYETSAYFGNPNITSGSNDSGEPFAYVSFAITGATITQIAFYNTSTSTGFESDNHSAIFTGNTVTIPTTFVPVENLTLGSQVATPVFVAQGTPLTVAISSSTPGASINYTTNGTVPTSTSGTPYTGPISVSQTGTMKAIAFETGMTSSAVSSATYTIPLLTVASSNNPSTYGGSVTMTTTISSGPTGTVTFYDGGVSIGTGTISGTTAVYTTTSLAAGTHAITAGWPGNASFGSVLSSAITQTVNMATPTITFFVSNQNYGVAPFTVSASSNSSGAITYSVESGPATISGSTVTIIGVGAVVLQASQAAIGNYTAGTQNATFTVSAEATTITFNVPNQTYGVAPFTVSASSNSSGGITYSVESGPATISGSTVTITGVGAVVLQASQAAIGNYTAGTQNATFTVSAEATTITFNVPNQTYGVAPFTVSASSNSSGAITYSVVSGPAAISGATMTITGVGTVLLQASQGANGNYTAGTQNVSFTVAAEAPTITFAVSNQTYGVVPFAASASSNSSGAITYSVVSGPATISGSTVTTTGVGTVVLEASQAASGNYTTGTQNASFTVAVETQTITFTAPVSPVTFGVSPIALSASSSSSLTVTFKVLSGPGTISGSTLIITGPSTVVVAANQDGNADYSAAPQVTQSIVVNPSVSITLTPSSATLSAGQTQQFTATVSNTSNTAVNWTISPTGVGTMSAAGLYTAPATISTQQTVTATATSQADSTQSASATISISPAQCGSSGYSHVRQIIIDHTKVPNTDQANFPFLFNTTDPTLANVANGGHVTSLNGYDIVFAADPNGQTKLDYELEEYNPATGQVIAWVRIPTLSHATDTALYVFYGNPNIITSQQNPTGVWDANYMGVWHAANNGSQLSLSDSTSKENNATNNGATATTGQIDGGMLTNGSTYATIGTPVSLANLAQGNATFSAWVNTALGAGGIIMGKDDADVSSGWTLGIDTNNNVDLSVVFNDSNFSLLSATPVANSQWSYVVVALAGTPTQSQATIYINGVPSGTGSGGSAQTTDDSAQIAYLANASFGDQAQNPMNGSSDEFRISNMVRSPDWIATEFGNQSSPATFYSLSSEDVAISPTLAILYNSQNEQFTASVLNSCTSSVTWSISPAGTGTLTTSGLYTAPVNITTQQTVTVTATSQTDSTKSASAAVTLMPPVAVTVTPANATISDGGQRQQFTAGIINTSNLSVTWTISPAGTGTIDVTGLYTAPSTIPTQQTVIVMATSQMDTTKSAAATITLVPPTLPPPVCASSGYSFMRAIVIDHTKIPNTDQANFPFLFNTTDPALATTANGGHVANFNGYDIMFSSDPSGHTQLNYELEEYNAATGQVIAWVGIPNLSHTTDTVLYLFYGNPSIAASQQNPAAVWDANFMGVWHVPNGTQLSLADSTSNGDNGTDNGATATAGQVDGGMLTNGSTYATIGTPANLANLAEGNATFSAWVNSASGGGGWIMGKDGSDGTAGWSLGLDNSNNVWFTVGSYNFAFSSSSPVPSGAWSYVTVVLDEGAAQNGQATIYINGVPSGTATGVNGQTGDDSAEVAYLSNAACTYFCQTLFGSEDEFRISNLVRSPDWITAEYSNQSAPATFYALYPENIEGAVPATATLYASQTEQFAAIAVCNMPAVIWSMSSGAPGTLTTSGLYTAPASIATQQAVAINATSQADGTTVGSATVTLMPPLTVSVSPSAPTLYVSYETQQLTASFTNATNTAVTWSVTPMGLGTINAAGLYTAPYFYTSQTVTITATSQVDPTKSASVMLTLMPVTVTPNYFSTYGGFSQQYTASVPVSWSLSPAGAGTISASGLFTPAGNITSGQFVTITATSLADPNASALAYASVGTPASISPLTATLIGGQTEQFSACAAIASNSYECGPSVASWSISPAGTGTIASSGLYTAPAAIATAETVDITATDLANPLVTTSATVTLIPPVVSVTQSVATLYGGQTEQFFAKIANSSNTAAIWTITPVGAGSISTSGLYSAPIGITSQQTVTITATSQAVPTVSASAVVTLSPTQCAAKAYSYVRSIAIDHTQVPNTDQANFPFLFSATDPTFASVANGGHVTSSNANDILFSSDSAGVNRLDFEIEEYNSVTGQILAWVRIPTLTHASDAVIYMFYGNPSVTASQQNSGGVWDNNYQSVYHLANAGSRSAVDSTGYGNNVPTNGLTSTPGDFDAAAAFNGTSSYIELPSADFSSYPTSGQYSSTFAASFGVWFKTSSEGVILGQVGGPVTPNGSPGGWIPALYVDNTGSLRGSFFDVDDSEETFGFAGNGVSYTGVPQLATSRIYNDNQWHFAALTYSNDGVETLYVDGQTIGSNQNTVQAGYNSPYGYTVGTGYDSGWTNVSASSGWDYFHGALEEVEVSNVARSSDWLQTEFLNQSSPSTFFALSPEVSGRASLNPLATSLYATQNQQFTVLEQALCGPGGAAWSMPAGSPGILSSAGLYTAPPSINTQQTVQITATTLGDQSASLNATVTLLPPISISVTPDSVTLAAGQSQQFAAMVNNASNSAVIWTISPAGVGTITASGLYSAPANITVQTVIITATSVVDTTQSASATVTLPLAGTPAISVTPSSALLYGGQTQQMTASVTSESNTAVTWSIDPAGVGTVSASGLYTAPATIATQQTVTVTASSQADSFLSASSMISLAPTPCASSGYSYQHAIVINHNQVPNTDQTNFPILFKTTDPTLASVANGGHVSSASGYDIIFSTDPNGLTKLDHEIEQYNPVTGQILAWVRIPTLSHTSDTVLYLFYGNPNVTTPQQNPTSVWDVNYQAVYHFANAASGIATDSTSNGNSGTVNNVSPVSGEIDGAAAFDGATSFIQVPSAAFPAYPVSTSTSDYPLTFGAWFQATTGGVILGQSDGTQPGGGPNAYAPAMYVDTAGNLRTSMFYHGNVSQQIVSANTYNDNNWHYAVDTYSNGTETLYVDGQQAGFQQGVTEVPNGAPNAYFLASGETNAWPATPGGWDYFGGNLDEVKISNTARSGNWIATEYNNQSSPATFYSVYPENAVDVVPAAVNLYSGQSQQFTATGACSASVAWSMPAGAPGTLTAGGLYTSPSPITSQQPVIITATSPSGATNTATVTLLPPVSVSITPASATLSENQNQQFTTNVVNSSNQTVTWAISPAGAGSIDASGVYFAPSTITAQQTVTLVAISQQDSTKSAFATVTLVPTQCASIGYGYQRVIVIDRNKVPNSDQVNFPFLFNTTDPDLASTSYGGHVTSPSGYDIFFSADPNGQTKLDHEIEEYNPATGHVIAWIRIPTLSHTTDTLVYVFYGNPNIISPQQNPVGVWNSNYQAVYHLASVSNGVTADSTAFANTGTTTSVTPTSGLIDGAAGFNGNSGYMQIPSADFPNYPTGAYSNLGLPNSSTSTSFAGSFGAWFKTASAGGILAQVPSIWTGDCFFFICYTGSTVPGDYDPAGWNSMLYVDDNGFVVGGGVSTSKAYTDNQWHFVAVTYATDGTNTLYVDGQSAGSTPGNFPPGYSDAYSYFVGTSYTFLANDGNWNWLYLNGTVDEVTVSNAPFSADWIQTEYNNQSSPATFYQYTAVSSAQVVPASVDLYVNQAQQFAVPGACIGSIVWTASSGAPGSLSATGLYTAPGVVGTQQAVTVTATSEATGTAIGNATITLLAQLHAITLVASGQQPYQTGTSQTFSATVVDQQGNPQISVTVAFAVSGANSAFGNGTTNSSGVAMYSYTGAHSGSDTVVASASISGQVLSSNSVSSAWVQPVATAPVAGVTLIPPPTLGVIGLAGAFTDNHGAVIEPIAIGASAREFVVPAGATQLQLGVNSEFYVDDGGPGFIVTVNGISVSVPPTAMPWIWTAGGLNTSYQYGIYNPSIQNGTLDGTLPVVAAANLTAGQVVSVAYQSGLASANLPVRPLVNANGDLTWTPGVGIWQGSYFPTLYMTTSAYPVGQPISFSAQVTDSTGAPVANVPITLEVTGANPQQLQGTTDSTGTAAFLYSGINAGTDTLEALASPAGGPVYTSTSSTLTWVNPAASSPAGSLALSLFAYVNDVQSYVVQATDANGNPVSNANLGFYVWGVDNFSSGTMTDVTGHTTFTYNHTDSGTYNLVAVESVGGNVIFSNAINGVWTMPTSTNNCNFCNQITVSINAQSSVTLPSALTLTGTVTDNVGITPTVQWTQVSGPGIVTFAAPQQAITTASFSEPGVYVVQLYATDTGVSATSTFQITVNPPAVTGVSQGWVGSPLYGSALTGIVPITVAPGVTLQSGTLTYFPASNTNIVTTLNANVSGSGKIGTLDTTMLLNGSYWIQLQATDTSGNSQYSDVLVTVAGNYKPGRLTAMVSDLVIPATGLPINIQRSYDTLNAGTSGDFGYGWNLGINVDLTVDNAGNVTFTLGGQRRTFYFAPQMPACTVLGCLFPYYFVAYTAEPGFYGTLSSNDLNCSIGIVVPDGNIWMCQGGGQYKPASYTYTDANGSSYIISSTGQLQSIVDRSGNGLSITPNGITSTTGLNVPFVRDSQNRITQITDPNGNIYSYSYDANGNLTSVTYPNTTQPSTYTYDANHLYLTGTDFRNDTLPTSTYYTAADTDPNGLPLNGRLASVQDALGETTSYAYNLDTNTTTATYPTDAGGNVGTATMVDDGYGMMLSSADPLGLTTTNVYDASHNLISVTDPLGHVNTYTYDSKGNKTSSTYPATPTSTNTTSTTQYNQYSEPTSTIDELGSVRLFNYDANYNPQSVTDAIGTLTSFQFNSNQTLAAGAIGFDISVTPDNASQFTYDANGNMTGRTDALGRTTSYVYNSLGQKLSMTEPTPTSLTGGSASTAQYTYDQLGNLLQTAAPLSRTTSSTFDGNGNKISDTDARGNVTNYQYDPLNRLIETDSPDGTKATKAYDFRNDVIAETDQNGNVTRHTYDLSGRQVSVTRGYGTASASSTTYAYDNAGRKISETDALGHSTTYTYDADNRLTAIAGVKGNFAYAYDNAGNRISQTDANGNKTQYQYDARKRLTVTTYPDSATTINVYDGPGNLASVTDQASNVVQYTYDAANQLKTVVQTASPNTSNNTNSYGYDPLGNLTGLTDENLHTTRNSFDLFNEPVSKTLPAAQTETRNYDPVGNLTSLVHFNGVNTSYTYDALNRLLSRVTPSEPAVRFTYTPTGKYLTSTAGDGTVNYSYDSLDRLVTKATPEGTLSYTYFPTGKVETITSSNANGASISYSYDDLNRLSTVVDNRLSGNNTTTYSYDPASNLATATYSNGLQSTFTYDPLNRLTAMSTPVSSYTYQLGPTGNRTVATEGTGRTMNWTYDGIYRLTNEAITSDPNQVNGSVAYGLDPVGNRLSDTSSLSGINSSSFSFNADDEVSTEIYDNNGNTLTTGGKSFTYDAENHLTGMSVSGTVVSIVDDAFGNRVAKTVNGATTKYLVEDDVNPTGYPQVWDELTGSAVTRTYTYGLQRISQDQAVDGAWTPSFYGYDGGGSVRQLTNSAGTVTNTYEYDAFGNEVNHTGTTPNNYLYRGEQYDSDLGLYYLRARYYDPLTGRFLSRDPADGDSENPSTLHKYLYAGGDPVNGWDPTGWNTAVLPAPAGPVRIGPAIEYAAVIGIISLGAVEGVKAVGCAVNIAETVNALRTPSGSFAGISVDLPGCTATKDCQPYEDAIWDLIGELESRYEEMLLDYWNLYRYRPGPNPANPDAGTWPGHQYFYEKVQGELQDAVDAAIEHGCPVPAEAYKWLATPPPSRPAAGRN